MIKHIVLFWNKRKVVGEREPCRSVVGYNFSLTLSLSLCFSVHVFFKRRTANNKWLSSKELKTFQGWPLYKSARRTPPPCLASTLVCAAMPVRANWPESRAVMTQNAHSLIQNANPLTATIHDYHTIITFFTENCLSRPLLYSIINIMLTKKVN